MNANLKILHYHYDTKKPKMFLKFFTRSNIQYKTEVSWDDSGVYLDVRTCSVQEYLIFLYYIYMLAVVHTTAVI